MILQWPEKEFPCAIECSEQRATKQSEKRNLVFQIPQYQLLKIEETSFSMVEPYGKQSDSLGCAQFRRSKTIEFNKIAKGVICFESFTFN